MEIINNKLNSLPEQVEENMLNIQKLAQYLKEAYKTSQTLTTSTNSIAISDTNAPTSVVDGWLLDSRGLLFKINGGDTINFLLEFYTDLKGVQGNNGADGRDGVDGTNGTNGTDGKSFILTTGTLIIGYTATIQDTDFNVTPKLDDLVLDGNSNVGIVTGISGSDISVYGLYSIKGNTGANGTDGVDGTTTGLISFNNVSVAPSDFVSSVEYTDYPYEAVVVNSSSLIGNVTGGMVTFDVPEANSGDYASVCKIDNVNGTITIYAKSVPVNSFDIPNIWVVKEI